MLFKVEYSIDKDLDNYLKTIWRCQRREDGRENYREKLLSNFPSEFKEAINKAATEEEARKVILDYFNSKSKWFNNNTEMIAKGMEYILNQNTDEIISPLEKVFARKFPYDDIVVYITTLGTCPYNEKEKWLWFMINRSSGIDNCLRTAKHELNHFMFHYYFQEIEKKIGEDDFYLLKEAMVYLTGSEDNYRPAVEPLGKYLKTISGKPIEEIIDLSIKFLEKGNNVS